MNTSKMNKVTDTAIGQQKGWSQLGFNEFLDSLGGSTPDAANRQIAQGTSRATKAYKAADATPSSTTSSRGVAMTPQPGSGAAWADLMGALRAPMQGYSEFELLQMIKNLRAAERLGILGQMSQAQAGSYPAELQSAKQGGAGGWLQMFGGTMGAAGAAGAGKAAGTSGMFGGLS